MKVAIIFIYLLTLSHFPQEKKSLLYLTDKTSYVLDKNNFSLPVWIAASETTVNSVHLDIPNIITSDGRLRVINYRIEPDTSDISVSTTGKLFIIKFDSLEIENLDSGKYSLTMIISGANTEPVKETLPFEIAPSKSSFVWLEDVVNWILNNFFALIWNLIQVVLLIFIFIFIFKMIFSEKKNSLNVLQVVNETGKDDELKGVAEGIDDILIYRLQEISRLSNKEGVKEYWLSRSSGVKNWNEDEKHQIQRLNVVGGEFSMDLQKIGDVSIGPVKIPFGSISGILLKLFGGNYVSGSLQKYGSQNKLILRLDRKPSLLTFKKKKTDILPVQYFEASWGSDNIMGSNLAEGIPAIVDELAYKLILELSKDAGTSNWLAYKYFLDGCKLFSDFEKNRTRIDLLRDSISIWRESVKSDPEFAKAHYNLGVANDWDGNIEDALFRYQKAISLNPELIGAAAHFNIARLFWENYKDETRTLSELEKAKQINPNIPEIYNLEGLAYSNKKESYSKEAELYQKAIDLNKENAPPVFYSNLCIAKFYLNQLEDAQAAGEKSYQFYGEKEKFIGLLETMAKIHYQKGENSEKFKNSTIAKIEFEKSVKYYKEVLLKDPENKGLLSGYGNALIKLNSYNYAMQIFRRVIRIYPEDPMAYQKIAECLVAQKQKLDEAEIYLQVSDILLKNGTELLKLKEALVKDYESLQQTKLCKGILACILNVFCDSNKNPDLFNDSIAIFNEIFQPLYDNTKSMIDAELLNHFAQALFKVNNYEETINRINHTILIYNNDENDERFFDLAKAYSDLANGYTNLIQKLFNEFRHNEYLESILKEKARMIPTDEVKKELMEATKKADESYRVIGNIFLDADMAFQNASYNYQNAGYLKQAVEAHLNNAEFLLKKESYQIKRDKVYTVARIECDKAIKIDNKDFSTFLVKGTTYYSSRQYAKAIPEYEKSVELNFSQKATHYNIGLCFYYMGEYEKASKAFQTVLKLDPKYTSPDDMNSPDAYQNLAMSLEKLGDMNGEVKILRDAVNVHPDKVKYHILLGKSLKRKNDLDEAAEEFRTALNLDKINFQKMRHIALTELADIYADNGADINSAEIYISEAKDIIEQLDPEEKEKIISQMENTAGWIYFNLNQYELAIKLLEKTLSKFLNERKFHSRLAVAYENYANSLSDLKLKKEYINKSGTQWEIISNLKGNDRYKKMADEHLANLTKV